MTHLIHNKNFSSFNLIWCGITSAYELGRSSLIYCFELKGVLFWMGPYIWILVLLFHVQKRTKIEFYRLLDSSCKESHWFINIHNILKVMLAFLHNLNKFLEEHFLIRTQEFNWIEWINHTKNKSMKEAYSWNRH